METWATTPHKPYKILGLHGHGVYRPLEKKDWIKINPIISRALQRLREFQWVFQTCPVWGLIFFCDQLWLIFDKTLDRSGMIQTWRILYIVACVPRAVLQRSCVFSLWDSTDGNIWFHNVICFMTCLLCFCLNATSLLGQWVHLEFGGSTGLDVEPKRTDSRNCVSWVWEMQYLWNMCMLIHHDTSYDINYLFYFHLRYIASSLVQIHVLILLNFTSLYPSDLPSESI